MRGGHFALVRMRYSFRLRYVIGPSSGNTNKAEKRVGLKKFRSIL